MYEARLEDAVAHMSGMPASSESRSHSPRPASPRPLSTRHSSGNARSHSPSDNVHSSVPYMPRAGYRVYTPLREMLQQERWTDETLAERFAQTGVVPDDEENLAGVGTYHVDEAASGSTPRPTPRTLVLQEANSVNPGIQLQQPTPSSIAVARQSNMNNQNEQQGPSTSTLSRTAPTPDFDTPAMVSTGQTTPAQHSPPSARRPSSLRHVVATGSGGSGTSEGGIGGGSVRSAGGASARGSGEASVRGSGEASVRGSGGASVQGSRGASVPAASEEAMRATGEWPAPAVALQVGRSHRSASAALNERSHWSTGTTLAPPARTRSSGWMTTTTENSAASIVAPNERIHWSPGPAMPPDRISLGPATPPNRISFAHVHPPLPIFSPLPTPTFRFPRTPPRVPTGTAVHNGLSTPVSAQRNGHNADDISSLSYGSVPPSPIRREAESAVSRSQSAQRQAEAPLPPSPVGDRTPRPQPSMESWMTPNSLGTERSVQESEAEPVLFKVSQVPVGFQEALRNAQHLARDACDWMPHASQNYNYAARRAACSAIKQTLLAVRRVLTDFRDVAVTVNRPVVRKDTAGCADGVQLLMIACLEFRQRLDSDVASAFNCDRTWLQQQRERMKRYEDQIRKSVVNVASHAQRQQSDERRQKRAVHRALETEFNMKLRELKQNCASLRAMRERFEGLAQQALDGSA